MSLKFKTLRLEPQWRNAGFAGDYTWDGKGSYLHKTSDKYRLMKKTSGEWALEEIARGGHYAWDLSKA